MPPFFHHVQVDPQRFSRSEKDGIVSLLVLRVVPERAIGEDGEKGGQFALDGGQVALVKGHPLGDEAAGVQAPLAHLKVILRVKRCGPFDPRMDRVGGDDVEFLLRGENKMAGVVDDDSDPRIVDHIVVLLLEIIGDDGGNERFDFADDDVGDLRIAQERPGGDARSASHDQHGAQMGMY